jgi:hypothetical protein
MLEKFNTLLAYVGWGPQHVVSIIWAAAASTVTAWVFKYPLRVLCERNGIEVDAFKWAVRLLAGGGAMIGAWVTWPERGLIAMFGGLLAWAVVLTLYKFSGPVLRKYAPWISSDVLAQAKAVPDESESKGQGAALCIVALCLAFAATDLRAQSAPTVSLNVTIASRNVPTVTWTSSGATSCVASGGWSGTKAVSGTQVLPAITASTTYTLTCSSAAATSLMLEWTRPTENTDGSALTDLAGFNIFYGTSSTVQGPLLTAINSATATTYTHTGITVGQHCYALESVNALGVKSQPTNIACSTITTGLSAAASFKVNVPSPPTGLTVRVVPGVANSPVFKYTIDGKRLAELVGFMPLGAPCFGNVLFYYRGAAFKAVAPESVELWESTSSPRMAAACDSG